VGFEPRLEILRLADVDEFISVASANDAAESVDAVEFLVIGNVFQRDFVGRVNGQKKFSYEALQVVVEANGFRIDGERDGRWACHLELCSMDGHQFVQTVVQFEIGRQSERPVLGRFYQSLQFFNEARR
jgi:hypothetical protein